MSKNKKESKITDEVIVFSTQTQEENEEDKNIGDKEEEILGTCEELSDDEALTQEESLLGGEYGQESEPSPQKFSLSGLFNRLIKKKEPKETEYYDADAEYENSEGVIVDIDPEQSTDEPYEEIGEEAQVLGQSEQNEEAEDKKEEAENKSEEQTENTPIEYTKAVDNLPVAERSDDVYADIVKNIEENVHRERTSRRTKYEREQSFVDAQNPFQRDRKEPNPGEENLSFDDVERKELKTFDEIFDSFKSKILPRKGEKKTEAIRKIVANVAVIVLICCGIAFAVLYAQSKKAEEKQLGLSSQIVDINSAEEEEQLWEDFKAKYPNIKTPDGMMAKYAYLYAINQQLVGWVSVPNSGIDVQVVQSANNKDYLKTDFYGNYSRYGCPFMDYRNDARYLNQNTIIYGHHMSDGLIFAELSKYKELNGFLESPVIRFDTLYKTQYFKVYAAFITNTREEDDNGYVFNYTVTSFASTQNFDGYIAALDERKLYTTGVDINSGDKLLTLSTCTYEFNDARLVIVGRMLRTGETVDIDTTYSAKNGNPHYPQVWYDKNGKTNPFAGATRWYPEG